LEPEIGIVSVACEIVIHLEYPIKTIRSAACGFLPYAQTTKFPKSLQIPFGYRIFYPGGVMNVKPKHRRRHIMKVSKAAKIWIDYHNAHSKKKYRQVLPIRHWSILSGFWRS